MAQKQAQTSPRRIQRQPLSQIPYKPVRRQKKFTGSDTIEFVVNGEEGIRLSDASEGNWGGFEGRDDRSLVGEDRSQIIARIQVRHSLNVSCRYQTPFPAGWLSTLSIEGKPTESIRPLLVSHALQINTVDFTAKRRPIPRTRLAAEVAKIMKKFIAVSLRGIAPLSSLLLTFSYQREKLNGHGTGHSLCGWGDVPLENVFLIRLVRVSVASWQPEFVVERPGTSCGHFSSSSLKALA